MHHGRGWCRQPGTVRNLAASFGGELSQVGEVLVARIRREEETLYPLYQSGH